MKNKNTIVFSGLSYFSEQIVKKFRKLDLWDVYFFMQFDNNNILNFTKQVIKVLSSHVWYCIGGYSGRNTIVALRYMLKHPTIYHWAGTDVLILQDKYHKNIPLNRIRNKVNHWAAAPWLVDELKEMGFNSKFVPLPSLTIGQILLDEPAPFPKQFTILTYLPDQRAEFYGSDFIIRLANDFPNINILVVGGKGSFLNKKVNNIKFYGWVENMKPFYQHSSMIVRMTKHDGYGGTVQEGLAMGRYAAWTYPFPGVFQTKEYEQLKQYVYELYELHKCNKLAFNYVGRNYIEKHHRPDVLLDNIITLIETSI
jgi:hypothetical protein